MGGGNPNMHGYESRRLPGRKPSIDEPLGVTDEALSQDMSLVLQRTGSRHGVATAFSGLAYLNLN